MLKYLSLTAKLVAVVTIVAFFSGLILERYNTHGLQEVYEKKVLDEMNRQALIERLQFDRQFKAFHQVAEYAAVYPPLVLHLIRVNSNSEAIKEKKQKWFLKRTMVSASAPPRVVMLFNGEWELRGGFYSHIKGLPDVLKSPSYYLRSHAIGQSMLTLLENKPWVLSMSEVKTITGRGLGYVLVASPIDSWFLNAIYRYNVSPNLVVLGVANENELEVIASSAPRELEVGQRFSAIEGDFIVAGKEFFDYGASDVPLTFLSLRKRLFIEKQVSSVMDTATKQSYTQSAVLLFLFLLIVMILASRMRKMSKDIECFTKTHLKASIGHTCSDSLLQLEEHISFLESTIITVRKQEKEAEEALSKKRERLQEFFDQAVELIQSVGPSGCLKYVNQGWLSAMGYTREEALSLKMKDFIHPDSWDHCNLLFQRLQKGEGFECVDAVFVNKTGQEIHVQGSVRSHLENGLVTETYAIFRDVTGQKRRQEQEKQLIMQMEHAQRLESLGVLAGGIAHDFNNLLTAIMGNATMAELQASPQDPVQKHLGVIVQASERAAGLCKNMLAYSGKGSFVIEEVSMAEILTDTVRILGDALKGISLTIDIADDVPPVEGDKTQLQQVMMNLLTNACEATEGQGVIIVRLSFVHVDQKYLRECVEESMGVPGYFACIEVSDDGVGMSDVTAARVFEPFFTTKFTGRGLGMSAMLGIVRGHKGAIHIDSELNRGTEIKVLIPAVEMSLEKSHDVEMRSHSEVCIEEGQTILVVDDEVDVRNFTTSVLEVNGFNVLTARDGAEAVDVFRCNISTVSLVLLDMTMPVMGGEEAFHRMVELDPNVKVIVVSGYSEDDIMGRFHSCRPRAFIHKPYRPRDLINKMIEVIS